MQHFRWHANCHKAWLKCLQTIDFWSIQQDNFLKKSLCDCVTVWHKYEGQYSNKILNTLGDIAFIVANLFNIIIYFDICIFCGQGRGFGIVSKKTSLCDILKNTRLLYPSMKGLGGGPECFLWSLVHVLNGLLLISLQLKGFYFWFFDVTQWRTVQIWGDLPQGGEVKCNHDPYHRHHTISPCPTKPSTWSCSSSTTSSTWSRWGGCWFPWQGMQTNAVCTCSDPTQLTSILNSQFFIHIFNSQFSILSDILIFIEPLFDLWVLVSLTESLDIFVQI